MRSDRLWVLAVPPNSDSDMSNQVTTFLHCKNAGIDKYWSWLHDEAWRNWHVQEGIVQGDKNEHILKMANCTGVSFEPDGG